MTGTLPDAGAVDAAACPACGSTDVAATHVAHETMFGSGEAFRYAECAGCRSLRLVDVPADLAPYYPGDYYSVDQDPATSMGRTPVRQVVAAAARSRLLRRGLVARAVRTAARRREAQTLLSILESVRVAGLPRGAGSPVLDVGSGSGLLPYALGLAGLSEVTGIDPFGPAERILMPGVRLLRRELGSVDGAYDLVMFHHSLEHVPDPVETLRQARARLAPGGRILVRMPTVSSWAWETYGSQWVQLDAPRHLALLSRRGMELASERAGLRIRAVRDDSTAFQQWGSEQVRLGIPLEAPSSHMVDPKASPFSRSQLAGWAAQARRLNAEGRGDQAAWVLEPANHARR